jgi:ornithine--oxo-acid transaminase
MFNFERGIMMNGGVEAADTAVKMTRRWGYRVKGIE